MVSMLNYFVQLPRGKIVLWCYLLWYLVNLGFEFDPLPQIWINSFGISIVIGFALMLSVDSGKKARLDHWQIFRLFAMPFCVSSFSSLIKGKSYWLIVPPDPHQLLACVAAISIFIAVVSALKHYSRKTAHVLQR
jgi:uncharacterized membrane protein